MNNTLFVATIVVSSTLLGACAAETSPPPAKEKSSGPSEPTQVKSPSTAAPAEDTSTDRAAEACVPKGTKPNDKGLGGYCDKTIKCASGSFCTESFGVEEGTWFCTKQCEADAECGAGLVCYSGDPRGKACVPSACVK